jgi:hypothetical protein
VKNSTAFQDEIPFLGAFGHPGEKVKLLSTELG